MSGGAAICAAVTCETRIEPGFLMCFDHWRMVPATQQRDLRQALHAMKGGAEGARAAYVTLRIQAILSLAERQKVAADHPLVVDLTRKLVSCQAWLARASREAEDGRHGR